MKFGRFFGLGINPDGKSARIRKARSLHGLTVKYVTEPSDVGEDIIGRGGNISVRNDELLVFSSGEILLRAPIDELRVADLLSGDGAVLTVPGQGKDGGDRKIIVYFVYYRK